MLLRALVLVARNLLHHRKRLLLSVAGVGFAVMLMAMQLGFRNALFDSTVQIIRELDADLIIFSPSKYAMTVTQRFPRTRLLLAESDLDVTGAYPLYIESYVGMWKHSAKQVSRPIRVIGFVPSDPVFLDDDINSQKHRLEQPRAALLDRLSKRAAYGLPPKGDTSAGLSVELSQQQVEIVGTFALGTDFANDGNLLMSANNYARYFGVMQRGSVLDEVDLGVVQLHDPAQAQAVKARLAKLLPSDVAVLTREEFIQREIGFWKASTPIGYIFFVGLLMGWVVGAVICYQIIARDISDHVGEYATLKAMGYRQSYFVGVVFWQAVLISMIGFVPGIAVSQVLYWAMGEQTGLLMILTPQRAADVFGLTLLLCLSSGAWAIRGLLRSDPANLF